jgi:hypothetical protein
MTSRIPTLLPLLAILATASAASAQVATRSPHEQMPDGVACTACHTSTAWTPLRSDLEFDHARQTGFALDGRHREASCISCHEDLSFSETVIEQGDCASCHLDVHLGTPTRPCVSCHTTDSFQELPPGIVHPADFPLEGAHLQASCESCHTDDLGGAFAPPDRECTTCHLGDYYSSQLVDHQALGFSTFCAECHSTLAFRDIAFNHFTISGGFELVGQHAGIECTSCHSLPGGDLPVTPASPQDCVSCHLDDYQGEHGGSGFPTDCLVCHQPTTWSGGVFDHFAATGFALVGPHTDLECVYCHVGSTSETLFSPSSPDDCYACHVDDYQREHGGSGITTDCLVCHHGDTWQGADFDHLAVSGFELLGQHAQLACESCHVGSSSETLFSPSSPQDCYACHQADYEQQHAGSGFTTNCTECHSVDNWGGATFDHLAATGFELIPNHDQLVCSACHNPSTNEPLFSPSGPQDCYSCHQADYQQQHAGSGFSTDCTQCHQSTTWSGATFDHLVATGFELIPNHNQLACTSCHNATTNEPLFSPSSPQDCYSCHQSDYNREHSGTGFSTDCTNCHQSTTWTGATFNHRFPITSGAHSNARCTDCHTDTSDYGVFTCTSACHHTQSRTDGQHSGVRNYSYDSQSCLNCHPNGRH